jgi:hypothetical protein
VRQSAQAAADSDALKTAKEAIRDFSPSETVERAKVLASNAVEAGKNVASSEPVQHAKVLASNALEVGKNVASSEPAQRAAVVTSNATEALKDLTLNAPTYARAAAESDTAQKAKVVASNAVEVGKNVIEFAPGAAMETARILKVNAEKVAESPAGQAVKDLAAKTFDGIRRTPETLQAMRESEAAQRAKVVLENTAEVTKNVAAATASTAAVAMKQAPETATEMASSIAQSQPVQWTKDVVNKSNAVVQSVEDAVASGAHAAASIARGTEHVGETVVSTGVSAATGVVNDVESVASTAKSGVSKIVQSVHQTSDAMLSTGAAIGQGVQQGTEAGENTAGAVIDTGKDLVFGTQTGYQNGTSVLDGAKEAYQAVKEGNAKMMSTVAAVVQGASTVADMASTKQQQSRASTPSVAPVDNTTVPRSMLDFLLPQSASEDDAFRAGRDLVDTVDKAQRRFSQGFRDVRTKPGSPLDQILAVALEQHGMTPNQGVVSSVVLSTSTYDAQTEQATDQMVEATMHQHQEQMLDEGQPSTTKKEDLLTAARGDAPVTPSSSLEEALESVDQVKGAKDVIVQDPPKSLLRSAFDSIRSRAKGLMFSSPAVPVNEAQGNEVSGGIPKDAALGSSNANTPHDTAEQLKKARAEKLKAKL